MIVNYVMDFSFFHQAECKATILYKIEYEMEVPVSYNLKVLTKM